MNKHELGIRIVEASDNLMQYASPKGVMVWRLSDDRHYLWPIDLNPARPESFPHAYMTWERDE